MLTAGTFFLIDMYQMKNNVMSPREAAKWSIYWLAASLVFLLGYYFINLHLYTFDKANSDALLFVTGFVVEKTLAIDNVLVFLLVFSTFKIPIEKQNRILFYGIIGAIVLRLIMIALGAALITNFQWVLTVFAVVLIVMAYKTWPKAETSDGNIAEKIKNFIKIDYSAEAPAIKKGVISASLAALLSIAVVDVVFAVDSIPAIFAITTDSYIVASANVMALLGLRAMYFLIISVQGRFVYLNHCLAIILAFIGTKLLIAPLVHIPVLLSLGIVIGVLVVGFMMSRRAFRAL